MDKTTLTRAIEAILFISSEPLSVKRLLQLFEAEEAPKSDIVDAIDSLRRSYMGRGVELAEIGGGYQFRTDTDMAEYVARLDMPRTGKLSQASLETLAIIAYRQPATRADAEEVRGVDCGGVFRTLLEKGLIRVVGKKDVPGRPLLYGTSKKFLEIFGLSSLTDLPTLREIEEIVTTEGDENQPALDLGGEEPRPVELPELPLEEEDAEDGT